MSRSHKKTKNAFYINRDGAALVEFALMFNVIVLLFLGIMWIGQIISTYTKINQTAQSLARSASVLITPARGTTNASVVSPNDKTLQNIAGLNFNVNCKNANSSAGVNIEIWYYVNGNYANPAPTSLLSTGHSWLICGTPMQYSGDPFPAITPKLSALLNKAQPEVIIRVENTKFQVFGPFSRNIPLVTTYVAVLDNH